MQNHKGSANGDTTRFPLHDLNNPDPDQSRQSNNVNVNNDDHHHDDYDNGIDTALSLSLGNFPASHHNQHQQQRQQQQQQQPFSPSQPPSDPFQPLALGGYDFQLPHQMTQRTTTGQHQQPPPVPLPPLAAGAASHVPLLPHQVMQRTTALQQQQPPSNTLSTQKFASSSTSTSSPPIADPDAPAANAPIEPAAEEPAQQGSDRPRTRKHPEVKDGEGETIVTPYPWATDRKAIIYSRKYLVDKGITTITGEVQCEKCGVKYEIEYDLATNFEEVKTYAFSRISTMHDRAPQEWNKPRLPGCKFCGEENSAKPVISERKRDINWLFLLLGQLLGCCTLDQLKYFCKHNNHHRTGAKDRILYTTYFELIRQLGFTEEPGNT